MSSNPESEAARRPLSAEDLLAGSRAIHQVEIPGAVLRPAADGAGGEGEPGVVRLRPLTVGTLALISRAAREDPGLVPLLVVKESLVEPKLSLDQIRALHVGVVHLLIRHIHRVSGLEPDGEGVRDHAESPYAAAHLLLARHFGWTPEQVSQLTPGQVAVYLAGVERLLDLERGRGSDGAE